jgi:hypothetical protein
MKFLWKNIDFMIYCKYWLQIVNANGAQMRYFVSVT